MRIIYFLLLVFSVIACSKDDDIEIKDGVEVIDEIEEDSISEEPEEVFAGQILIFNEEKIQDGLVLVNDAAANRVYLMNKKESKILKEWDLPAGIGNDAVLLENGNLLVALMAEDPIFQFGGYGGRMAIISPAGEILWDYTYSDENNLSHHDIEMLPNGNILFLAWERKSAVDMEEVGYTGEEEELFIEKILEINPSNDQIVWEWNSWNHLIQDENQDLQNFGVISGHPEKININYEDEFKDGDYKGDIMHANALEYDEENDLIYLSVNFFSEVWVIDHSTTSSEAKTHSGGNYGKGGDLVYRFGNPDAYENPEGDRVFFHNHNPTLVPETDRILVFSNGLSVVDSHSVVYELVLPEILDLQKEVDNEPQVFWSFDHEDLFSDKVSGAHRLPNGNTLITEGSSGFWEVTVDKEIVWRFEGEGFFWRGYHYDLDSPAVQNLDL